MIHHFGPWIDWAGGECPVAPNEGIQIQCRNETREQAEAQFVEAGVFYMWGHRGGSGDIVAYRVAGLAPSPDLHRGWLIEQNWLHEWEATHPDFDPTPVHLYDGPSDNRHVSAKTRDGVIEEIDLWIEENEA